MFSDFDISIIIRTLKKQKYIIIQAIIVCILIASYLSIQKTTQYSTFVNIQLKNDTTNNTPNIGIDINGGNNQSNISIEKEKYFITSKSFLKKVVEKLYPDLKGKKKKNKIIEIKKKILVTIIDKAGILTITIISNKKDDIILIANTIAEIYEKEKKELSLSSINNKLKLIEELLVKREKELKESEETIRKYQEEKRVFDMEGKAQSILTKIEGFEEDILQLDLKDKLSNARKDEIIKRRKRISELVESPPQFELNPIITNIKKNIFDAEFNKTVKLNSGYTEKNPEIVMLNMKIKILKNELNKEQKKNNFIKIESGMIENPLISKYREERLKIEMEKYLDDAKKQSAKELLAQYNEKIKDMPKETLYFKRLKAKFERNDTLYNNLMNEYENAKIEKSTQKSDVSIIDLAEDTNGGISYKYPAFLLFPISLIIGSIFGISIGFLREMSFGLFKTISEISSILEVPVESIVSYVKNATKNELYFPKCSNIKYKESIRDLALLIVKKLNNKKILLITSSDLKEGKTISSINIAYGLAEAGKKVCLIDGDMKNPQMHKVLKLNGDGLAQIIAGKNTIDEVQIKINNNLSFISAGAVMNNNIEFFTKEKNNILFNELKTRFDHIIIDSVALNVADTFALMKYIDTTLFIINLNKTIISNAKTSFDKLKKHSPNIFVFLNEYWS